MALLFITKNKHKFQEVSRLARSFAIRIEQLSEEKYEPKEMSLEEVSSYNAKKYFFKYKKPVIVDDTGVFFEEYEEFPGTHPKLMFNLLGYKGLLKLIEGGSRKAHFKTIAAFCDSEGVKTFEGRLEGDISKEPKFLEEDVMPYEKIFLYQGKYLAEYSRKEKNRFSHRSKAFSMLFAWLKENRK